jgi:alpha-D-ribose 1-methylphosphonate 5-triphosphate synthase subunit PhnI
VFGKFSHSNEELVAKFEPREFPVAPSFGLPQLLGGNEGNTLSISVNKKGYLGAQPFAEK